jgi:Response regulator containing a CheY-like receiver domain and a GGDEF domain
LAANHFFTEEKSKGRFMKNCLVVDDSKVIRKVARHILESLDLTVSEAVDGQDALTQCEAAAPDVVLLDWNMPVMSGMEFLQALSTAKVTARPKIIFCTTENGMSHIKAAVEAGADEYVMKPFDRETLESKLAIVGVI